MYKKLAVLLSSLAILLFCSNIALAEGEVIPQGQKRIVVLEFSLLDDLIALGVTPAGTASSQADEGGDPPYLAAKMANIARVGTRQQPNLEQIMALKPDLIIADTTFQSAIYPQLQQIAPTIMLNGLNGGIETQKANLKTLAKLTNTNLQYQAQLNQLNLTMSEAVKIGQAHPGSTLIGFADDKGQFHALTANALASNVLAKLSHPNVITVSRKTQAVMIPVETMITKNPKNIIVLLTDGNKSQLAKLQKNPLWQQVPAVKSGHVYLMDRDIWAKSHGILAFNLMLQQALQTGFLSNTPEATT